jgi:ankyrin repeat protein
MTLFEAIQNRSPSAVHEALAAGADLDGRDERGWTPLMAAAAEGHAGVARLLLAALLRARGKAALRATAPDGRSALAIAADHGHRPIVEALAQWSPGERVRAPKGPGSRAGAEAIRSLIAAAAEGHAAGVKDWLARGAEPDGLDADGRQAMTEAIKNGHAEVVRALIAAGADPDRRWNFTTTLMQAAEAGRPDVLRALIDGGADPDGLQALRETALMKAAEAGQVEAARALIEAGADVLLRDSRDRSALGRAIENDDEAMMGLLRDAGAAEPREEGLALLAAARRGDLARVEALIASGADLSITDHRERPALEEAVEAGHGAVVAALLRAGAGADGSGLGELLVRAAYWGRPDIARSLLDSGADPDGDNGFHTALAEAAEQGNGEVVRLLLDAGADPNKDAGGGSPLVAALAQSNPDIIAMLRDAGAEKSFGGQRLEDLRGAGGFDANDLWLLVRAPVEDAARAFAEGRRGAVSWERDAYGREAEVGEHCFLVFRFRGHPWTLIRLWHSERWFAGVSPHDAREVSRLLNARAIYYGNSDTAGAVGYELYESGELLERMDFCAGYGDEALDDEEAPDPDAPEGPRRPPLTFESRLRPLRAEEIGPPYDFADAFLREQDAFAPSFGISCGLGLRTGMRVAFRVAGMEAEDFERLDVVSLPPDAVTPEQRAALDRTREFREGDASHPDLDGDASLPDLDDEDVIPF